MTRTLLSLATLATASTVLIGAEIADEAAFVKLMKEVGAANKEFKTHVTAQNDAALTKSATRVSEIYKDMVGFWQKHKAEKAAKWAEESSVAAKAMADAATAKDWTKASDELRKFGASCKQCHEAHRTKADDGSYKIKW
jgi:hypothetical protein